MSNMKFKTYTKYKDSKIEWIEEIPADWKINKVKYLVDKSVYYPIGDGDHGQITPDMYQDKGVPYIRVQNLSWNGEILFKGMVYISEEINLVNKKSILKPQDLLIAKTGATIGKIGFMPKNINLANTTSSVGKITINKKIHSPFFWNYYFQSDIFQNQIFISAYQKSAQPGFNIEDLVDFIVIIPSLKEQFIIANFLDKKIAKIDELIEKDKKLIELLKEKHTALINHAVTKGLDPNVKMKDSGIQWVGEIPEGWEVRKLKHLLDKKPQYGANSAPESNEDKQDIRYVRITDIDDLGNLRKDSLAYLSKEDARGFELKEGDILFARSGATVGKVYYYTSKDDKCCYAGYLIRYVTDKTLLLPKFLYYYSLSKAYKEWINIILIQSTIENVSAEKYNNLILPIPPLPDQTASTNFLGKATAKIDKTIHKIQKKIKLLEEYKKSLIHHTVTGKIDVRGLEY